MKKIALCGLVAGALALGAIGCTQEGTVTGKLTEKSSCLIKSGIEKPLLGIFKSRTPRFSCSRVSLSMTVEDGDGLYEDGETIRALMKSRCSKIYHMGCREYPAGTVMTVYGKKKNDVLMVAGDSCASHRFR